MLARHTIVAVGILATAACGLGVVGSATGAAIDAGVAGGPSDTTNTDLPSPDADVEDAGIELPADPGDAGAPSDASTLLDAASDACALGTLCIAQWGCCAHTWCGRFSITQPFECQQCLAAGAVCNADFECCGGSCTGKPTKVHNCQ